MGDKIVGREELAREVARLRREGRRVVFTNGVFDLLHAGHVRYLKEAASLGDVLVVGLNGDASVRELKGPSRPIVPEGDRAEVLAALEVVDYVVLFPERTAEATVGILRPDVYVKGGDYSPDRLPEARVVQGYGGEVRLLPYHEDRSTTGIIQRVLEAYSAGGGPAGRPPTE